MLENKEYKPPIMYILIDTTDKTPRQMEIEVTDRVDKAIKNELDKLKNTVTDDEYKVISRKLAVERNNILKQFIFQIYNLKEINKEAFKEVELF